jgi:hypothetical protein
MMKTVLFTWILLFSTAANGFTLVYVEKDGLLFYYPDNQSDIARRLINKYPAMITFLEQQGLKFKFPLHVILDDDLDTPAAEVHMIPHREIRIPLRTPGVLEDGYTDPDPWGYFLFKGLCLQGIYSIRSGIPGSLHKAFGEIISPNIIMPEWTTDGICHLLYTQFQTEKNPDPFHAVIHRVANPPAIDKISNHPGIWPGHYGYRIYGRPFVKWVYQNYGWGRLLDFIKVHGEGIVPIEIDLKAKKSFGASWSDLWHEYTAGLIDHENNGPGLLITGYWSQPFVYWNASGVYPGIKKVRFRGRYGYVDSDNALWLSEYDEEGQAKIIRYKKGLALPLNLEHVWDPGPGGVAITRRGRQPYLVLLSPKKRRPLIYFKANKKKLRLIPAPPGVLQMSGPVQDPRGRIAVAANSQGNWDIWLYDRSWYRITDSPSLEMDPWWEGDRLVFASNVSGVFQIYDADMHQLTNCKNGAVLPREGKYLCLAQNGWQVMTYAVEQTPGKSRKDAPVKTQNTVIANDTLKPRPYRPLKSIWPNYLTPDIFASTSDFQLGIATKSRDVTGDYTTDAGLRYSFNSDYLSGRLGGKAKDFGLRFTRYPLDYETGLEQAVEESRNEFKAFWIPFGIDSLELSINYRTFEPLENGESKDQESWGAFHLEGTFGDLRGWGNLEVFTEGSQSVFGGLLFLFGKQAYTSLHMQAGKTWGELIPGHTTYRIGGNVVEGYFTQRPTRLFPLRGFDSNVLEAGQAVTAGLEIFWPLVNLQKGYTTFPLFLHRLRLGTFIDAGAASDQLSWDDTLIGAGLELVTSLEIAWGNLSAFRMGIAWPIRQPDILDEKGPVFLIQLGRPL